METKLAMPSGGIYKRFILSLLVFIGTGVGLYADLNITTQSATTIGFSNLTHSINFDENDSKYYSELNVSGTNIISTDFDYNGTDWTSGGSNSGSVTSNTDQNVTITLDNGEVIDYIINSTEQITNIEGTSFSDLYVSDAEVHVINPGSGWTDNWNWAPTYWDGSVEHNVTNINEFIYMSLTNNAIFDDNTHAMLEPSDTNTSGNLVEGIASGTIDGCTEGDCTNYVRSTNVIGSWELNTTSGELMMDMPNEIDKLSIVADTNSPTGYYVQVSGMDKPGTVWHEKMLTGSQATGELIQNLFATSTTSSSTTYNAYGYSWLDVKKDNRYKVSGNYVDYNATDNKFQINAVENNNSESRAEISTLTDYKTVSTLIKLKNSGTNANAQFRAHTSSVDLTLPSESVPQGLDQNTIYSMIIMKVSGKEISAKITLQDDYNVSADVDSAVLAHDDSAPFVEQNIKLTISTDGTNVTVSAKYDSNGTIIGQHTFTVPTGANIAKFSIVKLRSSINDVGDVDGYRTARFNVYNVNTSNIYEGEETTSSTLAVPANALLGSWKIYRGTNLDDELGCAVITDGREVINLTSTYGGGTLDNNWSLSEDNKTMFINVEGGYSQNAVFNSVASDGSEANVTCTFDNNWFMELSSEPRRLMKVSSCDANATGDVAGVLSAVYSNSVFDLYVDAISSPALFDTLPSSSPATQRFAWIGTWMDNGTDKIVEYGMHDVSTGSMIYKEDRYDFAAGTHSVNEMNSTISSDTNGNIVIDDENISVKFVDINMTELNSELVSKGINITMDGNDGAQLVLSKHLADQQCDANETDYCPKAGDVSAEIMYNENLTNKILNVLLADFNTTADNNDTNTTSTVVLPASYEAITNAFANQIVNDTANGNGYVNTWIQVDPSYYESNITSVSMPFNPAGTFDFEYKANDNNYSSISLGNISFDTPTNSTGNWMYSGTKMENGSEQNESGQGTFTQTNNIYTLTASTDTEPSMEFKFGETLDYNVLNSLIGSKFTDINFTSEDLAIVAYQKQLVDKIDTWGEKVQDWQASQTAGHDVFFTSYTSLTSTQSGQSYFECKNNANSCAEGGLSFGTNGILTEYNSNGFVQNAGTWDVNETEGVLYIHPTISGYETNRAYKLVDGYVEYADVQKAGDVSADIWYNSSAKTKLKDYFTALISTINNDTNTTSGLVCDYDYVASLGSVYMVSWDGQTTGVATYANDSSHTRAFTLNSFDPDTTTQTETYTISDDHTMMFFSGNNILGDYNITVVDMNVSGMYNSIIVHTHDYEFDARIYYNRADAEAYLATFGGTTPTETYTWQTGTWTSCDTNGQQSRQVWCQDSNGTSVSESMCSAETMPVTTQSCTPSVDYQQQCIDNGGTWDGVTCQYNTTGGDSTNNVSLFKMLFDVTNLNIANYKYDFTNSMFVDDGNDSISIDGNHIITISGDKGIEHIKYNGIVPNVTNLPTTLTAHEFCIEENSTDGNTYYHKGMLLEGSESELWTLKDIGFDIESLGQDVNKSDYEACTANDVSGLDGKTMYSFEFNGDYTQLNSLSGITLSAYTDANGTDPRGLKGKSLYYLATSMNGPVVYRVDLGDASGTVSSINWYKFDFNNGTFEATPFISENSLGLDLNSFELTTSSETIKYVEQVSANSINSQIFSTTSNAYKFLINVSQDRQIDGFDLNATHQVYLFDAAAKDEFLNYYRSEPNDGGTGGDSTYQSSFLYQLVGGVNLPALGDNVYNVRMSSQPINGYNWNGTDISKTEGNNSYILGLDAGKYVIRLEIGKEGGFEEYVYDAETTTWIPRTELMDTPVLDGMISNGKTNEQCNNDGNFWYQPQSSTMEEGTCYDNWPNNWIPNVQPVDTNDFNSSGQMALNFDLSALYNSLYIVSGNVTVPNDFTPAQYCTTQSMDTNDLQICEGNENGVQGYNWWYGANSISVELDDAMTGQQVGWYDVKGEATDNGDGTKTYSFNTKVSAEGNYTVRISKQTFDTTTKNTNWESYYLNPQAGKLVDDKTVQWNQSTQTDAYGNYYWVPDTSVTGTLEVKEVDGSKTVSLGDINFATFASNQIKLNGTVEFNDADNVNVELIDVKTGNYLGWTEIDNSGDDFNISLPQGDGQYIIRVSKVTNWNWESYYYNPTTQKFVQDTNINWIAVDPNKEYSNWIPDPAQTGKFVVSDTTVDGNINQADLGAPLNIDFTALDNQFYTLNGKVVVPNDFIPGDVCKNKTTNAILHNGDCDNLAWNNKEWLGYNNVNFDVTDTNGTWIGSYEINRDSNVTDGTNKTYDYKVKLSNPGVYIVRVNLQSYVDGINQYSGYYLNFQTNVLVSDRKVMQVPVLTSLNANGKTSDECWQDGNFWWQDPNTTSSGTCYDNYPNQWIPDTSVAGTLTLSDTNKSVTRDVDFVSLTNNIYKIAGTIKVPSGFVPSYDWENHAMIRVEALNADTGEFINDGPISDQPVDGTTDTYKYSINLQDVSSDTKIVVRLVKELQNGDNWDYKSYYINFGDDHAVGGEGANADKLVAEETVNRVESSTKDSYGNTLWIPDPTQTGSLSLGADKTINLNIDYDSMVAAYENNKISIHGKVILSDAVALGNQNNYWNSISVEALNKQTGEWVTSQDVNYKSGYNTDYDYELDFAKAGEYIIRVTLNINGSWEEYFVNFGQDNYPSADDKIVSGQKVQWREAEKDSQWGYKQWMPDPAQTGYIDLQAKIADDYNIDFSKYESSIAKISGTIIVPSDFTVGDKYTSSGAWNGYSNLRVEAISKTTGEWIASTDVTGNKVDGGYPFTLKIGDTNVVGNKFIVRIVKEQSTNYDWKSDEIYVNFGDNHAYDASDALKSGKRVQWTEAEDYPSWGGSWKQWMPNPNDTGWIELGSALPSNMSFDITQVGASDYKLSGAVVFKSDFNLTQESNGARISIIDASTGNWVADEPIDDNGSFSVDIGDVAGDYIVQINYWHNDYTNWQNSWSKNKYVDFGPNKDANGGDDTILNDSDVMWKSIKAPGQDWDIWIPNVNPLSVSVSVSDLHFDLTTLSGGSVNGVINGIPSGASNPYVMIVNPLSYGNSWIDLKQQNDGTYTFTAEELKAANYTVEFGYDKDGKNYHYFMKDDNNNTSDGVGTVDGQEVRWMELNSTTHMWGPNPEDTTYLTVTNGVTSDLNITVSASTYNKVTATLNGTEDDKYASSDMNVPGKSFGRWEQNTTVETNVSFTFDDVKDGSGYILNFWYDNNSYTCDGASCESLKKNAQWLGFDTNGTQVCPKAGNDWNCDWDNSGAWVWKPDVTPLTISGTNGVASVSAILPEEKTVSGTLTLGSDFANVRGNVNIYQYNGNDYNWADFTLGANGDANVSMKVDGGNDYRIEIWIDGLGGYVYTTNGWINQNNSWAEDNVTHMWGPKSTTLVNIDSDLPLGNINISSGLSKVTIVMQNLDNDNGKVIEDVWLNFEGDNNWYGEGNSNWDTTPVTHDSNITLRIQKGDYKLSVFPANHKGGYASNGNSVDNESLTAFNKLSWGEIDKVSISGDVTITITLPTAATLGDINGTVTCGTSDCSGWIEAWNGADGKGVSVNSDGTFTIKGLTPDTYDVSYWANSGLFLQDANVSVNANSVTNITLQQTVSNTISSITGTITATDLTGIYAVLISTDGNTYKVVATADLDGSGNFTFDSRTKPVSGKALIVAAAKRTKNADYSTSVKFDNAVEVYDASASVGMPVLTTEDFATSVSATAN